MLREIFGSLDVPRHNAAVYYRGRGENFSSLMERKYLTKKYEFVSRHVFIPFSAGNEIDRPVARATTCGSSTSRFIEV